jgi:hypothetical protein
MQIYSKKQIGNVLTNKNLGVFNNKYIIKH